MHETLYLIDSNPIKVVHGPYHVWIGEYRDPNVAEMIAQGRLKEAKDTVKDQRKLFNTLPKFESKQAAYMQMRVEYGITKNIKA